jgi:hypothetical protein
MSFFYAHAEQAAKAGVAVTTAGITTSFVATAMPIVQFIGAVVAVCVGLATLTYYLLQIREKLRAKK